MRIFPGLARKPLLRVSHLACWFVTGSFFLGYGLALQWFTTRSELSDHIYARALGAGIFFLPLGLWKLVDELTAHWYFLGPTNGETRFNFGNPVERKGVKPFPSWIFGDNPKVRWMVPAGLAALGAWLIGMQVGYLNPLGLDRFEVIGLAFIAAPIMLLLGVTGLKGELVSKWFFLPITKNVTPYNHGDIEGRIRLLSK